MRSLKKFIKEVEYAYDNVPFYGDKLAKLGLSKSDITADSYAQVLPFTEKRDYRKNFPRGVLAKGYTLNHPMLNKSQSSGTTGERLITFEVGMNLLKRAMLCSDIHPLIGKAFMAQGRKICRYAAPNCSDVECANPHSTLEDRLLADGTLVLPVYHDLMTTSDELIDRAIEEILTFKPDLFYVDPTHFSFLLRAFKKKNILPPKIPVLTSYSAMTAVSRRQIADSIGAEYLGELLSSSEMGWVAMQCPHGNMHLNDDSFFFEFIDENGKAALAGDVSELCISSTDQGAVPHLRYKTGDMVTLNVDCPCGNTRRSITMEGRATHFLTFEGKPVLSPKKVDNVIGAPIWLDVYQWEQVNDSEFIFKIITNERYSNGDENPIIESFKEQWSVPAKIRVENVNYIASERSGKFQPVKGLNSNV